MAYRHCQVAWASWQHCASSASQPCDTLEALPASIGKLVALEVLRLGCWRLAALPDSIGQLTSLQELDLAKSPLACLPDGISRLRALTKLCLAECRGWRHCWTVWTRAQCCGS